MQVINTWINTRWGKVPALSNVYRLSSIVYSLLPTRLVLSCVLCLASIVSFSQLNYDYTAGKFMIKGKVMDLQNQTPIPLANILFVKNGRGITCDNEGNFTLYVYKTDTLKFSSAGYLSKVIHMQDIDSSKYYVMEIQLMHDVIKLKDVMIYPYRDRDAFIDAFMDARGVNKVTIAGIAPPKYTSIPPRAKFYNPISLLYDKVKKRRAANPDFKP